MTSVMSRTCPGCGQVSSSATDRLVVDSCGHVKCRKCLLVEDSQCGQCHDMAWDRWAGKSFFFKIPLNVTLVV